MNGDRVQINTPVQAMFHLNNKEVLVFPCKGGTFYLTDHESEMRMYSKKWYSRKMKDYYVISRNLEALLEAMFKLGYPCYVNKGATMRVI